MRQLNIFWIYYILFLKCEQLKIISAKFLLIHLTNLLSVYFELGTVIGDEDIMVSKMRNGFLPLGAYNLVYKIIQKSLVFLHFYFQKHSLEH